MSRPRLIVTVALSLAALCFAPAAQAQTARTFSVGLMGGFGGSIDDDDAGLGNTSFQLNLAFEAQARTLVGLRYGIIDFGSSVGPLDNAELEYINVAGEYRFPESYFDSGLYFGIGSYSLSSDGPLGLDDSSIGLVLGSIGDFRITDRFSVLAEIAIHYTDLDAANLFLNGVVGFAVKF